MLKKEVKTLWAGRAWVHAKYLNECGGNNIPIQLIHDGKTMTIAPEDLKAKFDRVKAVADKFKPEIIHKQYGVVWQPDDDSNLKLL